MKAFTCDRCHAPLHFENTLCLACGTPVGFLPGPARLSSLEPAGDGSRWHPLSAPRTTANRPAPPWRMCRNYEVEQVCNWMVPPTDPGPLCLACTFNRTIPDLTVPGHRERWAKLESAKRRLIYSLLQLGLPLDARSEANPTGLAFDFLADPDPVFNEGEQIMTGHAEGLITINIAEADDAVREQMRLDMREVYRTPLGHFRHESGHYYWDVLVRGSAQIDQFRQLFGDERADYAQALAAHYESGPPDGWQGLFVTPYAASHPWEDWAESWSHWLHMIDTLETASSHQLELSGPCSRRRLQPPLGRPFTDLLEDWHALRIVLNALNRSMGLPDAYPFIISPAIAEKLSFIHHWIRD